MNPTPRPDPPAADWPLYWFAALERALDAGDFGEAARAVQELRRLGVEVTYRRAARQEVAPCRA